MSRPIEERIDAWHAALLGDPDRLTWWRRRKVKAKILKRFRVGFDGEAYTFPVLGDAGWFVRRYVPGGDPKWTTPKGERVTILGWDRKVARAFRIYLVEGEPDLLVARSMGFEAICTTGGAGTWREEWNQRFEGRRVAIMFDCDSAGREGARRVRDQLREHAEEVRVVDLDPSRNDGFDLTDFFVDGAEPSELVGLLMHAPIARPELVIESITTVAERIDSAPPPQWLFRQVVTADSYGVLASAEKIGKSWAMIDAAVSAVTGTPWLGQFDTERSGGVLYFAGEGGDRKVLRRVRAVLASRDTDLEEVQRLRVASRNPDLSNRAHLDRIVRELSNHPAVLVILDPLYLALGRDARSSDLANMGTYLREIQYVAQDAGAALLVAHHLRKTGRDTSFAQMTGAGPSAWGRILLTGTLDKKESKTLAGGETLAVVTWQVVGDEIPAMNVQMRRRVWADDPDDLASALNYEVATTVLDGSSPNHEMRGAMRRVLQVLNESDRPIGVARILEELEAGEFHRRTVETALLDLQIAGLAECSGAKRQRVWWRIDG